MMKIKISFSFAVAFLVLISMQATQAQDAGAPDASKPTNFYTLLENTFEYSSRPNANVYGYRGNITYAPSESHLILGEVPFLYNDRTKKSGIGDIRGRYFWLPYKNYDKFFGAFGPSIDVFAPTGSFRDGLGTSRWIVAPGVTAGLIAADWIQFFPILSYQYISKPQTDLIPEQNKTDNHGATFQVIIPIVFSSRFFIQVTPLYAVNDFENAIKSDGYIQELSATYTLSKKLQLTGFFKGDFHDEIYTYRIGLTCFF
jgi:hypothetical protein